MIELFSDEEFQHDAKKVHICSTKTLRNENA